MYILQISTRAFIKIKPEEVVIVSKYEDATKYDTIGDAMRVAANINYDFEKSITKVIFIK